MPVRFNYNPDKNLLYGTIEGKVSIQDLEQALRKITTSEEYSSNVNALWDLRKLDFTHIDSNFGEELISVRGNSPARGTAKIALITDKNLGYGMSRMYEMLSSHLPQEISVFKDKKSAEDWLLQQD